MRAALFLIVLFTAACGPPPANAPSAQESVELAVRDAWIAPTPGGVDVSAGYATIVNSTGAEDRLVALSSPRAQRMEIHEMSMDNGVMRMRAADGGLAVPAGATVTLSPGGQHLMFFGVTQPFAEGETIPVTLTFAQAGDIVVQARVQRAAPEAHDAH